MCPGKKFVLLTDGVGLFLLGVYHIGILVDFPLPLNAPWLRLLGYQI